MMALIDHMPVNPGCNPALPSALSVWSSERTNAWWWSAEVRLWADDGVEVVSSHAISWNHDLPPTFRLWKNDVFMCYLETMSQTLI